MLTRGKFIQSAMKIQQRQRQDKGNYHKNNGKQIGAIRIVPGFRIEQKTCHLCIENHIIFPLTCSTYSFIQGRTGRLRLKNCDV